MINNCSYDNLPHLCHWTSTKSKGKDSKIRWKLIRMDSMGSSSPTLRKSSLPGNKR